MTPEGEVKKAITELLKSYGEDCWVYMPVPSKYGSRTVDYHVLLCGTFFVIEAKRPGEEPTPKQSDEMQRIIKAGGLAWTISETSMTILKAYMDGLVLAARSADARA